MTAEKEEVEIPTKEEYETAKKIVNTAYRSYPRTYLAQQTYERNISQAERTIEIYEENQKHE